MSTVKCDKIKSLLDRIHRVKDLINQAEYEEKCALAANDEKALQFEELPEIQSNLNPQCLRKNGKPILFMIGGPGSLIKKMAKRAEEKFEFTVISCGDILQNEINSGSPLGLFIEPIVTKHELDIVVWLLKREILDRYRSSKGLVIEGFPRTQDQLLRFEKEVARAHIAFFWKIDYTALRETLVLLKGEKKERLREQICIYRKYTAPIMYDVGKRGKLVFGDLNTAWKLLDLRLSNMLLEWCFITEDVAGLENVKINYIEIPKLDVRGEPCSQSRSHMFALLGGIIPYLVNWDCARKPLERPQTSLY